MDEISDRGRNLGDLNVTLPRDKAMALCHTLYLEAIHGYTVYAFRGGHALYSFESWIENLRLAPSVSMKFRRFLYGFLQHPATSWKPFGDCREQSEHPISSGQQSAVHQTP
jgi:hypothetical protein